jgi:ABC-type transport system substrate-binding protein
LADVAGWRQPKAPDIAEAKLLMEQAGYGEGVEVKMNLSSSPNTVRTAEVVAEQLRETIGVDITLEQSDRASAVARIREGNHHISVDSSGVIITDPSDYLNQHFVIGTHKNPDGWTDDRLTPLIQAQAMERDPAARLELFQQALEILREGHSQWVPTSWGYSGAIMDYRLQGYNVPESEQLMKHWEGIWWDPDVPIPPP